MLMIRNLIFDFGKVLVDYDYFGVIDGFFASHAQAEEFYNHLMDDKWNEKIDRGDSTFEHIIRDMQEAMPQWRDEIGLFGERYTDLVIGEMEGMRDLLVRLKAQCGVPHISPSASYSEAIHDLPLPTQ